MDRDRLVELCRSKTGIRDRIVFLRARHRDREDRDPAPDHLAAGILQGDFVLRPPPDFDGSRVSTTMLHTASGGQPRTLAFASTRTPSSASVIAPASGPGCAANVSVPS